MYIFRNLEEIYKKMHVKSRERQMLSYEFMDCSYAT